MSDAAQPAVFVSVVIPVKNAAVFLPTLFARLSTQKPRPPDEVILVDSQSEDNTRQLGKQYGARVIPIERFSHGRARNLGAREARGDIIVLMTQDAVPAHDEWLRQLLEPFADPRVAAVYSRQIPREDANPMERYFLLTHFPPGAAALRREKSNGAGPSLRNVFFSNVSGAVRRSLLLQYPFDETLIMSEDQQLSRDLIEAGYAVVYQPASMVVHSHNYTLAACVKRYFDSVYSLTQIFPSHDIATSVSMGWCYVWGELRYVMRHAPLWLPYYGLYTAAKTLGTMLAHVGDRLPYWVLKRVSLHRYHWEQRKEKPSAP